MTQQAGPDDLVIEPLFKPKPMRTEDDIMREASKVFSRDGVYTKFLEAHDVGPGTAAYDNAMSQAFIRQRKLYPYLSYVADQMNRIIDLKFPTASVSWRQGDLSYYLTFNPELFVLLGLRVTTMEERIKNKSDKVLAFDMQQAARYGASVIAHECVHFMAQHISRGLNIDPEDEPYWTIGCELAVNSSFKDVSLLPTWTCMTTKYKLKNKDTGALEMIPPDLTADAYMKALKKAWVKNPKRDSSNPLHKELPDWVRLSDLLEEEKNAATDLWGRILDGLTSMDDHSWNDKEPQTPEEQETADVIRKIITQKVMRKADAAARSAGHDPGNLQYLIDELLKSSEVNFTDLIQGVIGRHKARTRTKNAMRLSRRTELPPGKKQGRKLGILFMTDVSMSMSNHAIATMMGEAVTAHKKHRAVVHIQQFDHGLQGKKVSAADFVRYPSVLGRGGTELYRVFDFIEKERPDLAVICTDGYVDIPPQRLSVPLVWLLTPDHFPRFTHYGAIIRMPNEAGEGAELIKVRT